MTVLEEEALFKSAADATVRSELRKGVEAMLDLASRMTAAQSAPDAEMIQVSRVTQFSPVGDYWMTNDSRARCCRLNPIPAWTRSSVC